MAAAFVDVGLSDSNNGSVASKACAAINAVAGNAIIVFTRYEDNDTTVTITDTAGNTWTELTGTHIQQGSTGGRYTAHYCLDCLGHSTNVVTMTLGANKSYVRVSAFQWSGIESLVNHETASATGTSVTGAGLTATEAGVLIAGMGSYNARTHSLAGDLANNRGRDLAFPQLDADGDVINTGSGTYTGAFTSTASTNYALINILFSSVAGGTTVSAGTVALAITEYAAAIEAAIVVNANSASLAITTYPANVVAATTVNANSANLVLTTYIADIIAATTVNAGTTALALTTYPASIETGVGVIEAGTVNLALTTYPASVEAAVVVAAGTKALTLSTYAASIVTAVGSITYTLIVGNQMITTLADTKFPLEVAVDDSGGVTGLTVTASLRDPDDSTSYLDFNDGTFKSAGWVTKAQALTEYGSGFYGVNLDVSAITNFPAAQHTIVEYDVTGSVIAISASTLTIAQTWENAKALTVGKFLGLK